MSEAVKTKKQKKSWFKGLKAEFSKIIWPDQKSLTKETIAVLVVSVLLGVIALFTLSTCQCYLYSQDVYKRQL